MTSKRPFFVTLESISYRDSEEETPEYKKRQVALAAATYHGLDSTVRNAFGLDSEDTIVLSNAERKFELHSSYFEHVEDGATLLLDVISTRSEFCSWFKLTMDRTETWRKATLSSSTLSAQATSPRVTTQASYCSPYSCTTRSTGSCPGSHSRDHGFYSNGLDSQA
jgi:hypothetical protein